MAKLTHITQQFFVSLFLVLASGSAAAEKHLIQPDDAKALHDELRAYVGRNQVANLSFGVWQDGQLVADGYYGPINETAQVSVSDTTIHRIQSMTKPVTAIGLLILLERGYFRLDDPITKFMPEFEQTETLADYDSDGTMYTYKSLYPPTMEQLLSHTAGFGYWQGSDHPVDRKLRASNIAAAASMDELVQAAAQVPYVSMPGADWHYSMASDLQGAMIERMTGEPLSQFLDREVFKPLGMIDTAFHVPDDKRHRLSAVTLYDSSGIAYASPDDPGPIEQAKVFSEGGHGLFSTQRDYYKFLDCLRRDGRAGDRQLLLPKTIKRFRTNAIRYRGAPGRQRSYGAGAGLGFGFGVGIIEDPQITSMSAPTGTYYWRGAMGTWFWVDPINQIVFIGMVQNQTEIDPDLLKTSMQLIYGAAPGEALLDGPAALN